MNLTQLHTADKSVSATALFKGELGIATAIQIKAGSQLKEHITKTPALLICVSGIGSYNDEQGNHFPLTAGEYVEIAPLVKHWIDANEHAHFILLK